MPWDLIDKRRDEDEFHPEDEELNCAEEEDDGITDE